MAESLTSYGMPIIEDGAALFGRCADIVRAKGEKFFVEQMKRDARENPILFNCILYRHSIIADPQEAVLNIGVGGLYGSSYETGATVVYDSLSVARKNLASLTEDGLAIVSKTHLDEMYGPTTEKRLHEHGRENPSLFAIMQRRAEEIADANESVLLDSLDRNELEQRALAQAAEGGHVMYMLLRTYLCDERA